MQESSNQAMTAAATATGTAILPYSVKIDQSAKGTLVILVFIEGRVIMLLFTQLLSSGFQAIKRDLQYIYLQN